MVNARAVTRERDVVLTIRATLWRNFSAVGIDQAA